MTEAEKRKLQVREISDIITEIRAQQDKMQERLHDLIEYGGLKLIDYETHKRIEAHIFAERDESSKYMRVCEKAISALCPGPMRRNGRLPSPQLTQEEVELLNEAKQRYLSWY